MNDHDPGARYSMRVVTRLTGVPADTLRSWERRYDAVVPVRTAGNTRRYTADDVRRLTLLRQATERGHKIGDIARLAEDELTALLTERAVHGDSDAQAETSEPHWQGAFERARREYLNAVDRFDVRAGADLLARWGAVLHPQELLLHVVLPILRAVGDRWACGELSVAQEHLVSMQLRSLVESMMRLRGPRVGTGKILVATPAGHRHEFGALAGAFLAASRGFDAIYLGADVPRDDLLLAVELSRPRVALLSVILREDEIRHRETGEQLDCLAERVDVWVGCDLDHPIRAFASAPRFFHRFEDLDTALADLAAIA